ncbi:MAG: undecaprenyldiphospho-muramoylpentapeptide beta-N-acetylglucosaminyltransferase [Bacteroidales bacterium]|nr:undecaprenyldiphospho-muramoylpentapeptide beta-N-acetylglucosaminyltransferase [Candidatus Equibacterium intestinale]
MKRIIISGGGTGGHIFPAISIADALKRSGTECEIQFVGALGKMEMERVPKAGYPIIGLPTAGLQRKLSLKNLALPFKVLESVRQAKKIIREFKPDAVVGVGGYASAPLLWAASGMKVPCLIQEQNSYAGLTNKLLGKRVQKICVAYDGMEKFFPAEKIMFTGNPLRAGIMPPTAEQREEGYAHFGLDPQKKTLFVVGGSLGARTLNESVQLWIVEKAESAGFQVLWQSGKYYKEGIEKFLESHPCANVKNLTFVDRMGLAYAVADVIVSRAGAGTISELCVSGKATIFVPSPNVAEDHQRHNAMALVEKGAADIVLDSDAREKLMDKASALLANPEKIAQMEQAIIALARPDAADVIASEVLKLCK